MHRSESVGSANEARRLVLFVNDSYFAYLLARPIIELDPDSVGLIVLSSKPSRSVRTAAAIVKRSSLHYASYRSFVQILPAVHPRFRGRTVADLARRFGIPTVPYANANDLADDPRLSGSEVGIAVNFDQILGETLLDAPSRGVMGIHASRLPADKGISPALWAFARGDQEIWVSIYLLTSGVDDGPIIDQFSVPVRDSDTAFSLYERVCSISGERLIDALSALRSGFEATPQTRIAGAPLSWPDASHQRMMKSAKRKFIGRRDVMPMRKT